jgi:hypothetical protein
MCALGAHFDIYGVNPKLQKNIFDLCREEIRQYDELSQTLSTTADSIATLNKMHEFEESIKKKIRQLETFAVVGISSITYPNGMGTFSTLDLVPQSDSYRMPQSPQQHVKKTIEKPQALKTLFQLWNDYFNKTMATLMKGEVHSKHRSCPVAHCIEGFTDWELKNLAPQFESGAEHFKKTLIDIIQNSSDEQERGQAIFILANTRHYEELANLMAGFTDDASELVRNNSMRVLSTLLSQHPIKNFDLEPILLALNYPYVTDRNKAAYIVWELVRKDKATHSRVIKAAGDTLIHLLELKQPNNHDIAYMILKELSHEQYSERDYSSWKKWMKTQRNKI